MKESGHMASKEWWLRTVRILGGILLLIGGYLVLSPFLVPIAWSAVLASVTWPIYRRMRPLFRGHEALSALTMLSGVILLMVLPVILLVLASVDEANRVYLQVRQLIEQGPSTVRDYPWLVRGVEWLGEKIPWEGMELRTFLVEWAGFLPNLMVQVGQDLFQNFFKVVVTVFILFFMYRDGERFLLFSRRVLPVSRAFGERLISQVGYMVKSVVYGIFITAISQGFLAGLGFWGLGFEAPVLMGLATAVLALIPFGAVLIWVPAAIWLFIEGSFVKGIILAAWGAGVVSTIDNLLRPILISYTGSIPVLLVFLGSIGGFMAFGMIGLFMGPVILSVGLAIVEEYVKEMKGP